MNGERELYLFAKKKVAGEGAFPPLNSFSSSLCVAAVVDTKRASSRGCALVWLYSAINVQCGEESCGSVYIKLFRLPFISLFIDRKNVNLRNCEVGLTISLSLNKLEESDLRARPPRSCFFRRRRCRLLYQASSQQFH
jgi:hypothetical protein